MYAGDLDRDIASHSTLITIWKSLNLSRNQKVFRLGFHCYVLPQMMLKVRPFKERAEHEATLLLARYTALKKRLAEAPEREAERQRKVAQKQAEKERKAAEKAEVKLAKQAHKAAAKSASQATAGQKRKRKNTQLEEKILEGQSNLV